LSNTKQIVDCIGQVIQVGDVIMPTNDSALYGKPQVVTRIGASDNIQTNGQGYASANMVIKINEQYVVAKGQQAFDSLVDQYKPMFNYTPVQKKKPTPQYVVVGMNNYSKNVNGIRIQDQDVVITVVEVIADNTSDRYSQLRTAKANLPIKDQSFTLFPDGLSGYDTLNQPRYTRDINYIGIKKLKELGLDRYIGGTISVNDPLYEQHKQFYLEKAY
jgi:hypothetical protein